MRNVLKIAGFITITGALACSVEEASVVPQDGEETEQSFTDEDLVSIPVSISESGATALNLAPASAYSISLDSCASGYTSAADETDSTLAVYKFDRDCLAKLTAFTAGGISYQPQSGSDFTTWLAGDEATFEEVGTPANTVTVRVVETLAAQILGTETINYAFSEVDAGVDENIADSVVGDSNPLQIEGQAAPAFSINAVNFVGINATGGGEFEFKLECDSLQTGTDATAACEALNLTDVQYKLVDDTFGGAITAAEAQTIFASGESSILTVDVINPGEESLTNGGFTTTLGAGSALAGPDQMHLNPNMLLIIEADDTSYLYFNIDVTTVSQ